MSERERFDVWCIKRWGGDRGALHIRDMPGSERLGEYVNGHVQFAWEAWQAARSGQAASGSSQGARSDERTGWPPGLLQDDSRELSRALASKPDAMAHARDAVAKIGQPEAPTAARRCQFCKGGASGSWCPTAEGCAAHGCHGECLPEDQEAPTAAALVPVAKIKSAHGDPEAFGERELVALVSLKTFPYGTLLYAHPPARSGAGSEEAQPDRTEES